MKILTLEVGLLLHVKTQRCKNETTPGYRCIKATCSRKTISNSREKRCIRPKIVKALMLDILVGLCPINLYLWDYW